MSGGNIKVVVRCRPLNTREVTRGAKGSIRMEGSQTILDPPDQAVSSRSAGKKPMVFSFDKSYWSAGPRDEPGYASQSTLYDDLGVELLTHSFDGFNTCIFAYGQTGSGKSYSMMGYGEDKGIIPLTTSELFNQVDIRMRETPNLSFTVEVSYIEIYNEKVRDLLNPRNKGNLRVREHPSLGPYVEDLSKLVVEDYGQMMTLMDEGNKARTVASTNMNETSSRSHAVFTVILTQKRHDPTTKMTGEKVSKISLVDLAGSERQGSSGATGARLKEGANINKSLTTLGKVIAALASASAAKTKKKNDHVPYRDSVLTWLLKESLGGNSKTAMIAAISPADYEETLSTLRYADAAKKIKTHAVVNEDPNAKLIRELKEELDLLRSRISAGVSEEGEYDPSMPLDQQMVTFRTKDGEVRKVSKLELQDQLQASEKLMEGLNQTWEEKMEQTRAIHSEREKALEEMGISIDKDMVGVHAPQKHPSLVNLNEDPLMSECLVYQLKPGTTIAGSPDSASVQIRLSGPHILLEHCTFTNDSGTVSVATVEDARMFVNGKRIPANTPIKLLNGFRVILGDFHVFRFNDPASVRKERQQMATSSSMEGLSGELTPATRPDSISGGGTGEMMDWNAARREMADIEKLGDQDLDKLFDDIMKVRTQRGKRPESRYSLLGDMDSRFYTPSQTDETLDTHGNPWAGAMETTMTPTSIGTPQKTDVADMETIVVETSEIDRKVVDQTMEDSVLQQQHLTKQLKTLAQEVKRIRSQAAKSRALEQVSAEPADWTARELRLVKSAIEKWKRLRGFAIAEQILCGAVGLREANVIATKLDKRVSYNFLVTDGPIPASSLNGLSGVVEFEDVSGGSGGEDGPRLMTKVIDRNATAVYAWDSSRFRTQSTRMKQVHTHFTKPGYTQHFKVDEPFVDRPAPSFSFIGAARIPLRLLANRISSTVNVPILCPYTAEAIGSCRVDLRLPISDDSTSAMTAPDSTAGPLIDPVELGDRLAISITVDAVRGLSSNDFASVHTQTRLTSLMGDSISSEDTFASMPVDLNRSSITNLSLRKSISVIITADILRHFNESSASIDFFAKVNPEYLDRLERWDKRREDSPPTSTPSTPSRQLGVGERPGMRRNETDFIGPEHHDILASVEILEMSMSGEYVPADVTEEVFQLHQGLQRRIGIKLHHTSGHALPWTRFSHVSTGDVRTVTKGVSENVGKGEVELRISGDLDFASDGTSTLVGTGTWDTASHEVIHLNRKTPGEQQILVRLTIMVEVENLDEPATLSLDLPIRVLDRDSRRSSYKFWSAVKIYPSITAIFAIDLAPPLAQSASELWRLDTARKHVKGEVILDGWRPRSLSLIEDFERLKGTARRMGDVQATKAVLEAVGDIGEGNEIGVGHPELLRRCVDLWTKAVQQRVKIDVKRDSPEEMDVARRLRKLLPDLQPKLVPTISKVSKTDSLIKAGALMILRNSQSNTWEKMTFALRRPYLLIHPSITQREVQAINLTRAHAIPSPDVQQLLERRFAFTLFTPTNSFILQAPSQKEMLEWISVITATSEA